MLSRVQDPGNAGTILRVADAAGADLVITTKGSVDLYNPKTVRSTAGSLFHVPIIQGVQLEDFAEDVKSQGTAVLAADGYWCGESAGVERVHCGSSCRCGGERPVRCEG